MLSESETKLLSAQGFNILTTEELFWEGCDQRPEKVVVIRIIVFSGAARE